MRAGIRTGLRFSPLLVLAALAGLAVLAMGCGGGRSVEASVPGGPKTFFLTALEYKGSTEASREPFPSATLPAGGGYGLKAPSGDPAKWEVNSYAWAPSTIVVVEGDEVTLKVIGINGAQHVAQLEGHVENFTIKRGEITTVSFIAGKPGVYALICATHAPNMTGELVVLPRSN